MKFPSIKAINIVTYLNGQFDILERGGGVFTQTVQLPIKVNVHLSNSAK
jgi:hypothetical protein